MMSYLDGGDNIRLVSKIGRIIGAIVIGCIVSYGISFGLGQYRKATTTFDDVVNEAKLDKPSLANMFVTMKREFPSEYSRFASSMTNDMRAGATREQVRQNSNNLMKQFVAEHAQEFAQAPSKELEYYNYLQIKIARSLASVNPKMCAHFVMNGFHAEDIPPPDVLDRLGEAVTTQLNGIAAGRRSPVGRNLKNLPQADSLAMVFGIKTKGVSDADMRVLATPGELARASDTLQCKLGIGILEGISTLPVAQLARIKAYLITHT